MGQRLGTVLLLLLTLGYLVSSLATETKCENIYQGFSNCVLKLGKNMASYEEDNRDKVQGLNTVCGRSVEKKTPAPSYVGGDGDNCPY
ncbi:unnamed protein product [Caretta caretta]